MTREEEIIAQAAKEAQQPTVLMHPYASKQHKLMSAYEIGFIEGAVWADAHPNWISVENGLPEQNRWVLTYNGSSINLLMFAGNGGWYDHSVAKHRNVTHWMPLPAPPTVDKSSPDESSSEKPNNCKKFDIPGYENVVIHEGNAKGGILKGGEQ